MRKVTCDLTIAISKLKLKKSDKNQEKFASIWTETSKVDLFTLNFGLTATLAH